MSTAALLLMLLSGAPSAASVDLSKVSGPGIEVAIPEGWTRSSEGTTTVLTAPGKYASARIDLFSKENTTPAKDCMEQLLTKMSNGKKEERATYSSLDLAGQPGATQTTFAGDRKHKSKRLVGCNGKSYFLIDWVEATHAAPKLEKAWTQLLVGIRYVSKGEAK